MNCDRVQDLLSEAIDGTLVPADARDFHAHLAACPPCRVAFGDVKESMALLGELPAVEVGDDFDETVWRRIRAEARPVGAAGIGDRLRGWLEAVQAGGGLMRWAPLGAAAAVLSWVAISSDPAQMVRSSGSERDVATTDASDVAARDSAAREVADVVDPEFVPVEYSAGMPNAIEQFLRSGEESRLSPSKYRQSSYHYPIRPVRDPLIIPVSTGASPVITPDPRSSMSTETGVPVLAF